MQLRIMPIVFLAAIFFFPILASSRTVESPEKIKNMAKAFLEQNIALEQDESLEIQINSSDVPKKLATCSKEIEINFPREANKEKISSVELTCNGENSWHTFMPVNIQKFTKVIIAKHAITADQTISEDDLDFSQANINRLYSGYFKDKNDLVGKISYKSINAGMVITKKSIHNPQLIKRNQEIDLVARKNAIEVTMKGIAKSDGALNDTITAYNPSSKKTLEAVVVGLNKAEVIS